MKQHNIGNELIEAISKMEAADEWPIVLLLLELAQFRLHVFIKSETDAGSEKKAAA
jgi:hypothetical protein